MVDTTPLLDHTNEESVITQSTSDQPRTESNFELPSHISEHQARESLLNLAGQKLCWGKKAAREMNIGSIESANAFHYKLETFSEARKSSLEFQPYYGGSVDGPQSGTPPSPWDIIVQPNAMFRSHEKHCEIPHTAYVKLCHDCNGFGEIECNKCKGRGKNCCSACSGSGYTIESHTHYNGGNGNQRSTEITSKCLSCNATGYIQCSTCSESGKVTCETCEGEGKLRFFMKLTVTWTVNMNEHVVETALIPDHLIIRAQGTIGFEETSQRVNPISHSPHPEVNLASQRIVHQHWNSFSNEKNRILSQRHKIRVVPIYEVTANYSNKEFIFWVYGCEQLAYCPYDYPQTCCCGCCTIL